MEFNGINGPVSLVAFRPGEWETREVLSNGLPPGGRKDAWRAGWVLLDREARLTLAEGKRYAAEKQSSNEIRRRLQAERSVLTNFNDWPHVLFHFDAVRASLSAPPEESFAY